MQQGVVRAYVAAKQKFVPVAGTDENGFSCQLKKYSSQGLQGVQVGSALYADALAMKPALDILGGKKVAARSFRSAGRSGTRRRRSRTATRATRRACSSGVSSPADGINLTPQQVLKYMK